MHSGASKEKKELARANAKIEFKTVNRDAKGGAPIESLKKEEETKKEAKKESDIWGEEEVNVMQEEMPDDRLQPEFEVRHSLRLWSRSCINNMWAQKIYTLVYLKRILLQCIVTVS